MNDRLYRSRHDRMLAGVAGGLAELWDVDPSILRLVWALLVIFTGGLALLVYIIMAIVVPDEEEVYPASAPGVATAPPPPTAAAPGPEGGADATPSGVETAALATAPAAATFTSEPPPGALWGPPAGTPVDARTARRQARDARRAARRGRNGFPGAVVLGLVLVAIGVFFLAREWIPSLDWDWFWPLILVGLGVILLVGALTRRNDESGGAS
jgi:phage shock protein PspC (stress-responsive transcriptional regulator)